MDITATCILPGSGKGLVLASRQPISFWGCVDPKSAIVSDKRHELFGESIASKVLVFPYGKGSSTGSLMILELLRRDLAPAAIVNLRTEPLLATGAVVGKHFYGKSFPILNVAEADFQQLHSGLMAEVVSAANVARIRV